MKKNLFSIWLLFLVILFSVNMEAQMTIGGKKAPESFSVLELLNKGGLRLPQMTTTERNAFAVAGKALANGLTIYNKTTSCVEYWNGNRWVSLCEGTSQTAISPQPCVNVGTDGSGCNDTYSIDDPDCPNGPFTITIVAGSEYASLYNVDTKSGKFQINFNENSSVFTRSILVRVTSTCNSSYKDFLFSQKGVDCTSITYAVPTISPATANLSLCSGGAVYLSVPATTANLDKLIWTRNGIEVARGVSYYVAKLKGKYNVSMAAIGCNTSTTNERNVTESTTTATTVTSIIASNNGILCGTNSVTLTAVGNTANVVWYHNGIKDKTGATNVISGDAAMGDWFAVVSDGTCFSQSSNVLRVTKSTATGQVVIGANDPLVNGKPLTGFTAFCQGGTLDLSVANKKAGIIYTWYNGNDAITSNPFPIPSSQTKMTLRLVATDNSGSLCPAEASAFEKDVISGGAPAQPDIIGNNVLCDGTTDLTIVPKVAGTYTYNWYKGTDKMPDTTPTITVNTPGVAYYATVSNLSGCSSTMATKVMSPNISSLPVLSWVSKPATATFGSKVTVQTSIEFGPANAYTWLASGGATITGSGASVTIQFPASGTDGTPIEIKVTAENACGKSVELKTTVSLNNTCPTPVITAQSAIEQTIISGANATVAISVSGGVNAKYQWYSNSSASAAGSSAISGATSASVAYKPSGAGTTYVYCIVTNGCVGNLTATSPFFTVITRVNPDTLPIGTGTFGGKTCFDIAEGNDNTSCGALAARTLVKSDFNLTSTNTQIYTFIPTGIVSKVRFSFVESVGGVIVSSVTSSASESALNISGAVTATVVYKKTISSPAGAPGTGAAYGKTEASALSVVLYAVYNNKADGSGTDVQVQITAKMKDCACCGAYVSPTLWKTFMCHNLGANENLNPFTPSFDINGAMYLYGSKSPAAPQSTETSVSSWNSYYNTYAPYGNLDGTKTNIDPCPAGYRVPTAAEWNGVFKYNTMTAIGPTTWGSGIPSGRKFGESLMLPIAGYRDATYNGQLGGLSSTGFYLQSIKDPQQNVFGPSIGSGYGDNPSITLPINYARSIRCISEY